MLAHKSKPRKNINPKKQKRQQIVNIGKPLVPISTSKKSPEHEKLSDWANAS